MAEIDARLREDVHLLGELLGDTIRAQHGEDFLERIERIAPLIRALAELRGGAGDG